MRSFRCQKVDAEGEERGMGERPERMKFWREGKGTWRRVSRVSSLASLGKGLLSTGVVVVMVAVVL